MYIFKFTSIIHTHNIKIRKIDFFYNYVLNNFIAAIVGICSINNINCFSSYINIFNYNASVLCNFSIRKY